MSTVAECGVENTGRRDDPPLAVPTATAACVVAKEAPKEIAVEKIVEVVVTPTPMPTPTEIEVVGR